MSETITDPKIEDLDYLNIMLEEMNEDLQCKEIKRQVMQLQGDLESIQDTMERLTVIKTTVEKHGISQPMMEACDPRGELVASKLCCSYDGLNDDETRFYQGPAFVRDLNTTVADLKVKADGISKDIDDKKKPVLDKEAGKRKYGDVEFADEENNKYPIDTKAHIFGAWAYIHMKRNAERYDAVKLKIVKERIKAAAKAHGIDLHTK